ncbi:MAG: TonB-dependent receptor [Thermoanaerobaculia bacterium]|nr:TonB-dependent receptor [Thermoanaerobaculia bacterium]
MRWLRTSLLLLGLVCLALTPLAAQGSGRIEGSVVRQDGAGLGGVAVVLVETGAAELTGGNGAFTFAVVPAGTYTISYTLGANTAESAGVEVTAGQTTRVTKQVDWNVSFAETITVTSASRRVERIVEAPAAVTLITEQEIERQAAHGQLPKLLEFTPGAEVTQSGLYDYNFNTRGFNSSLNRRVATLIDGRNPSVPFLGAQEWAAVSFPLDDLAGAELVRGPSAALYGANASSGVLNLVTKQPRYSQGGMIRLTAGEVDTTNIDARWAGELGGGWYTKLLGGLRDTGDFTVSRVGAAEYARPCGASPECLPQEVVPLNPLDDNSIVFGGLRFDKYFGRGESVFTVEGGYADLEGPAFQTGIGRVQLVDVSRPWARLNYTTNHWNALVSFTERDADRQTALGSGANLALDSERVSVEVQTNWSFAEDKGRFVGGVYFIEEDIDSADPVTGRQTLLFAPVSSESSAAYAQVDFSPGDRVKLVLAGRYDESDLHDSQFSPKAAIVYSITPNHTLRLTYNEAFQVPNYSEFFLQAPAAPPIPLQAVVLLLAGLDLEGTFCAPFGVTCGFASIPVLALGNAALEVEEVETLELGYSAIINGSTFLTLDYYRSDNTNFITDLIPQLGTALGRVNPAFGPYQPPGAIPGPVAAILQGTLAQVLGPAYFVMSNNLNGAPILAAASYANFGEVDTEGIDLGINHYFDNGFTFSLSYSWFSFEIVDPLPGLAQILLPNTPKSKWSSGLAYTADRWNASASVRWVDDFFWAVGPFQGTVREYTVLDVNANYDVSDRVTLGLQVANATDKEHWESFGGDLLGRRALGSVTFSW